MNKPIAMTRFVDYVRWAISIVLAVKGFYELIHIISIFCRDGHHSSTDTIPLMQITAYPCGLIAVAYILVFRRYRVVALTVLILCCLAWWLPSVIHPF